MQNHANCYDLTELALSDNSLNSRFATCPRKFELAKLYRHAHNEQDDMLAADAGTALHRAWQQWLITGDKDIAEWTLFANYPLPLIDKSNDQRSLYAAMSTLQLLINHAIGAEYQVALIDTPTGQRPAIEVPFRIALHNVFLFPEIREVPVFYDGYIDAIMYSAAARTFPVFDLKTTRKDRLDFTVSYKRDEQCLPYGYVLNRIVGEHIAMLTVHYMVAFIDLLAPRVQHLEFTKTQSQIEAWAFHLAKRVRDMQLYAQIGEFPKYGRACDTYRPCVYNDVCDYTQPEGIRNWLDLVLGPRTAVPFVPWFTLELTIPGLSLE